MGREDWYRNKTWNPEIAAAFEARLKRSRSEFAKAQYLRIQGDCLIFSADPGLRTVGLELTKRVVAEYPEVKMQVTMAYETLGDFYLDNHSYLEAEKAYRELPRVMDHLGNGLTEIWQAKLAKAIFLSGQREKYREAKQLVYELMAGTRTPAFNSSRFECFLTLARLSKALNEPEEASIYAEKALRLAAVKDPQFPRHPTVGLPMADERTLYELKQLAHPKRSLISRLFRFKQ